MSDTAGYRGITQSDVVRIIVREDDEEPHQGTGFFVAAGRVATALHVVADGNTGRLHRRRVTLEYRLRDGSTTRRSHDFGADTLDDSPAIVHDVFQDWIAFPVDHDSLCTVRPLGRVPVGSGHGLRWETCGFPLRGVPAIHGSIVNSGVYPTVAVRGVARDERVIQLHSVEASAGSGQVIKGFSGVPVVLDGRVVGLLRAFPGDASDRAVGGSVFATPIDALASRLKLVITDHDPRLARIRRQVIGLPTEQERARHTYGLFAREQLLDEIVHWIARTMRGWVLLVGSPGVGKSAIMAELLCRLEQAGTLCVHHFVHREQSADPRAVRNSLAAQLELAAPHPEDPDGELSRGLVDVLARVATGGRKVVLLVDGLDEASGTEDETHNPIPLMLPDDAPQNVVVVVASRQTHSHLGWFKIRRPPLRRYDLDVEWRQSNVAAVAAFWQERRHRFGRPLDDATVRALEAACEGNMLFATRVYEIWNDDNSIGIDNIPRGLDALFEELWTKQKDTDSRSQWELVRDGLGVLARTAEAVPLSALEWILDVDERDTAALLKVARPWLHEEPAHWLGVAAYRPFHETLRAFLEARTATRAAFLHRRIAAWGRESADRYARRYGLKHGVRHLLQAGEMAEAIHDARDVGRMTRQCVEHGPGAVEHDLSLVRDAAPADERSVLEALLSAVRHDGHWLGEDPEATPQILFNRLRATRTSMPAGIEWPSTSTALVLEHPLANPSIALRVLVGHTHWVHAIACLPDRRIVSASRDHTLRIWNPTDGRTLVELSGHSGSVSAVAVLPDGRIVSASRDNTLRVWNAADGRTLAVLSGHSNWVSAIGILPGRRVVSASHDRTLRIWEPDDGRTLVTLSGHTSWVNAVAVLPNGRVVSASQDATLRVWNPDDGSTLAELSGHTSWVNAVAVLPNGRVVSGSQDRMLRVWNPDDGSTLAVLSGHSASVRSVAVLPDGRIVSASYDDSLRVWNPDDGSTLAVLSGHSHSVNSVIVLSDCRVVSGSLDHTLRVWNPDDGSTLGVLSGHSGSVNTVIALPDDLVVSASEDDTLRVWNPEDESLHAVRSGHSGWVYAVVVLPNRRIVSGSSDHTLRVWSPEDGSTLAVLSGHSGLVCGVLVLPDGRVVSASSDQTLRVWSPDDGSTLAVLSGHCGGVDAVAALPDGRIVSKSTDGTLRVWNADDGSTLAELRYTELVRVIAVLPDGRIVSSAGGPFYIWRPGDEETVEVLPGHSGAVHSLAVLPDGRVVSGSYDSLRVWNPDDCRTVTVLPGSSMSDRLAVLPDGRIVCMSRDCRLRVWDPDNVAGPITVYGDAQFACVASTGRFLVGGDAAGNLWWLRPPL